MNSTTLQLSAPALTATYR